MDYRALLIKYIAQVRDNNIGEDFIDAPQYGQEQRFAHDELVEMKRLADEALNLNPKH